MKLVISDKDGKSYQADVPKERERAFVGLRIGDVFDAGASAPGYKLRINGGSDGDGTPMRRDVKGARRVRALLSSGAGFRGTRAGERRIKKVRGDTVTEAIVQLNASVAEAGAKPLAELFPAKPKVKT